jgi:hypothetical protein
MADYYAAASKYEQLSVLSDAELHRRRLSRANLAREVLAAGNRPSAASSSAEGVWNTPGL